MIHNTLIIAGKKLPTLTTPGDAADLLAGKQLIDADGNVLTGTMPSLAAQAITPGTADQTIAAGKYLSGAQTIKGDANLLAANIKSGVSIFGVSGELVAPRLITTVSALEITSDGYIYLTLNSFPEDFNENWYISGYTAVPEYSVKPFCLVINEPVQWGPGFGRGMLKYTTSGGYMATSVSYDISAKQLVFSGTTNLLSVNYSASSVTTGSFTFWDQAVTIS